MRTRSAGRPASESLGGGTGVRVGRGGRGRRPREGNDDRVDDLNIEAGHAAYTNRFHELARLVPNLVTLESRMIERYVYGLAPQIRRMVAATEPKTIQKVVQIFGALTDEAVRNRSIKKVKKRGNVGETLQAPYNAPEGPCRHMASNLLTPGSLRNRWVRSVPRKGIRVDAKLNFMEEPVEILEREFKKLKRSRIAIVKFGGIRNVALNSPGNVKIR
ncbi:hypothetical protein Tco_0932837 [Tanacetum coccineum]